MSNSRVKWLRRVLSSLGESSRFGYRNTCKEQRITKTDDLRIIGVKFQHILPILNFAFQQNFMCVKFQHNILHILNSGKLRIPTQLHVIF